MPSPLQSEEEVPTGPLCSWWFGDTQGWAVTSAILCLQGRGGSVGSPALLLFIEATKGGGIFHGSDIDEEKRKMDGWPWVG